jgi:hypothetical protein
MPLPSESIRHQRHSLAWTLVAIAFIAADLAALRAILPRIPNPGIVIMVLILEVGLFRMASQRGATRAFWLGFEVAGWAYVITSAVFAWTAWRMARFLFEAYVLRRPIGIPYDMTQFIIFAGSLQLVISLAIAMSVGSLARTAWCRWGG